MEKAFEQSKLYREEEARRIFSVRLGHLSRFHEQRRVAGQHLFHQFAELAQEYGGRIWDRDVDSLTLSLGEAHVYVTLDSDGWPHGRYQLGLNGVPTDLVFKLSYDPVARRFEGDTLDPEVAPTPGQLRPRRSALAVLVSAVMDAMLSQQPRRL